MPQRVNHGLLKIVGIGFGVAVTIGGTIGTGILRKPGPVAAQLGDPGLIMVVWSVVSVYALLGTLCTIELGTSIPRAGAWYVYAQRAFGNYTGFVVGINSWLGTCAALGFGVYTFSEYVTLLFPVFQQREVYISVLFLLVLGGIHGLGLAVAGGFQRITSVIKAVGLILLIGICFVKGKPVTPGETLLATSRIAATGSWLGPVIFSLQSVFYTFDGWHTAAYFTEEDRNPSRNLPRSMIGGVLLVILIYLLVNMALLYVMPMNALAGSKLAAADAVRLVFGEGTGRLVTVFLMISIVGIVNAQLLFNPRVLYSMSRDGLFIRLGTRVNKGGTPFVALPFTAGVAIILIMAGREVCEKLSDVATFFFILGYISGFASLIALRRKEPQLFRPWRVPAYPALPIGMALVSTVFLVGAVVEDPGSSWYALLFLMVSYPLYRLVRYVNK